MPGAACRISQSLPISRCDKQTLFCRGPSYLLAAPDQRPDPPMVLVSRFAVILGLLTSFAAAHAQELVPGGQQHTSPPEKRETERKAKPVQDEPALPQSPGATFTEHMKQGMKAEPPCRGLYPCVLTTRQKFHIFAKRSVSPYTFAEAAFDAGYSQLTGDDYGRGMASFAKRYGANLVDSEARSFFQTFVYSSLFGQDPRYHRLDRGSLIFRASYAASRVFVGRTDSGHSAVNFPELLGVATSSTLTNAYYPERDRGVKNTINRAIGDILSDSSSDLLREFWPDIRRMLRRHEPRAVKRLEDRVTAMNVPGHRRRQADTGPPQGDPQQ
jgi:hypothetical protein